MRLKTFVAVLGVGAVVACAPVQSGPTNTGTDEQTGQLRVWLFDEVNRAPKEAVVKEAISEFQAAHSGVTVDVQYIQVSSRAERFKAAFSDPKSAPDVAEFGNTDLAGYVVRGRLLRARPAASGASRKDLVPTIARHGQGRRQDLRRAVVRRRPRAVLPHRRLHRTRPQAADDAGRDRDRRRVRSGRRSLS